MSGIATAPCRDATGRLPFSGARLPAFDRRSSARSSAPSPSASPGAETGWLATR